MSKIKMKPLNEQVIVLTGSSSGIGLATAKMAAERGAKVVLSSPNEDELRAVTKISDRKVANALSLSLMSLVTKILSDYGTRRLEILDALTLGLITPAHHFLVISWIPHSQMRECFLKQIFGELAWVAK